MEIIRFEVKDSITIGCRSIHIEFEPGHFIIKDQNGRAYFNEESLIIMTSNNGDEIKNKYKKISFMSFDEGIAFQTNLGDINDNSNLLEMCQNYINGLSEVSEDELKSLMLELNYFNNCNLIDYALRTGNKGLFLELTATLK